MEAIQLTDHLNKNSDVYIFAEDIVRLCKSKSVIQALFKEKLNIFDKTLAEQNIDIKELPSELVEKIKGIADGQKKKIEEYPITIINQSLQILCSLFESYLIEVLEKVIKTKKETIIILCEQKQITLNDLIKLNDYNGIISYFIDKILRLFSREATEDQFNKYFEKIGIKVQKIFDMGHYTPEVQKTYHGWGLEKLCSIFNERHDIVHNGLFPLKNLEELYLRKEFFFKLIINIAIEINKKFKIPNDLKLPIAQKAK